MTHSLFIIFSSYQSNQEKTKGKIILQTVASKLQLFEKLSSIKDNEAQKTFLYIFISIKFDLTHPWFLLESKNSLIWYKWSMSKR